MPTYNANDMTFVIDGQPVTGYGDEDFITGTWLGPGTTSFVGPTGETCFVESNDQRGEITVSILQSAAFNAILSGIEALKTEFIIALSDDHGATSVAGAACRLEKMPDFKFSSGLNSYVWKIVILKMVGILGGKDN